MTAADRPSVTDDARAEAQRRYQGDWDPYHGEPVDDAGFSEAERRAFMAGAEWAAGRVETTTATTEDAALVIHETQCVEDEHGDHCIFWEEDHQSAQALADAGLLARPLRDGAR